MAVLARTEVAAWSLQARLHWRWRSGDEVYERLSHLVVVAPTSLSRSLEHVVQLRLASSRRAARSLQLHEDLAVIAGAGVLHAMHDAGTHLRVFDLRQALRGWSRVSHARETA